MKWFASTSLVLVLGLCALTVTGGCGSQASEPDGEAVVIDSHEGHDHAAGEQHDHGGWWCVEHGIPEEECSLCSAEAAEEFKAQGDWCEEHQRAESQCFVCDPSRAEKYAKLYEAKYGHAPPKPTE